MTQTVYVLGFLIWNGRVLLIRKNRPAWQAGKLNGVGGKVESSEWLIVDAMIREFREESGIETERDDWRYFARMRGEEWACYCFVAELDRLWQAESLTDELLGVYRTNDLPEDVLPNLRYLIPMALDRDLQRPVDLRYR